MAASGQRAFANKLNKRGAAEVRKQVSSAYFGDVVTKSTSGLNLSLSSLHAQQQNVPLCDVVEPPDFEDIISCNQNAIDRDSLRHLLEFPMDDMQGEELKRKIRTVAPVVPERGYESIRHVKDCVKLYTKDYFLVKKKYENYNDLHNDREERAERLHNTPRQEFEMHSIELDGRQTENLSRKSSYSIGSNVSSVSSWANSVLDLKNSPADALVPHLLEPTPLDDIDAINKNQRQTDRQDSLFTLYPQQPEEDQIELRQPAALPSEHFGHRLIVRCVQLKLDLEFEPMFASMALYNVRDHKKISENFYFDMMPDTLHKMIEPHVPFKDPSTMSRSAIFEITHLNPDIYLVIKLDKVLQQGEISEVAEPYMKEVRDDKSKEKDRVRLNAAQLNCDRLGKYRMPFGWTAIHMMNVINTANTLDSERDSIRSDSLERKGIGVLTSKGSTPDKRNSWTAEELSHAFQTFRPVTLTSNSFFKQEADKLTDEDLFKFLADLRKPSSILKKVKCMPGNLKIDIAPCPPESKYCLTPELCKVEPFPDENTRPTREIVEFPTREIFKPHTTYRNLLFVYPKSLNFASRQGSARNIAVKVRFMEGEDDSQAMNVIFGKSSCPEYSKEAYTIVNYHNKTPAFYDEVKIKLPARLGDGHHLLFTIYHISCQKKIENVPLETIIGYTWLPLLRDGRLLTGEFSLPVSLEKPPPGFSMLHPEVQLPQMKWVDNHKGLFTVNIDAISSIHTLDEHLDRFLNLVNSAEDGKIPKRIGEENFESELKRAIYELTQAKNGPLVRFMPLTLDKLLQLMVRPPVVNGQVVNIGQVSFEAMAHIVRRLQNIIDLSQDKHGRNGLLTSYIQYMCTLPSLESGIQSPSSAHSPGNYATMGRPGTLPVSRQGRLLSSSDPDLPSSSPEKDPSNFAGAKMVDMSPVRQETSNYNKLFGRKLVHEELTLQWVVCSGPTRELALSNAWFFFELIIKSMEDHLARTNKLFTLRKFRFSMQLTEDIQALVTMIIKDIVDGFCNAKEVMIKNLNSSLAFFIRSCLSLMDRGFVFQLIRNYCKAIVNRMSSNNNTVDVSGLLLLKLDFVRIVCSHEHYMALNLPFRLLNSPSGPPSPTSSIASSASQASFTSNGTLYDRGLFPELTNEYRTQHFLSGLVLSDISTMLETQLPQLHNKAIGVVSNLLASHYMDPRFRNSDARARIASLYLPLIGIVIDSLPQLYDPCLEAKSRSATGNQQMTDNMLGIDQTVAMAIAGSSIYTIGSDSSNSKKCSLSQEATQDLLLCFIWVLKNVDQRVLRTWWSGLSLPRLSQLLEVIYFCVSNFEYKKFERSEQLNNLCQSRIIEKESTMETVPLRLSRWASFHPPAIPNNLNMGKKIVRQYSVQTAKKSIDMKTKMEEYMLGSTSARSEMMRRKLNDSTVTSPSGELSAKLRWRKDQTHWKQNLDQSDGRIREESDCFVEGLLTTEISMVALDTIELTIQIVQNSDSLQGLLSNILRVLLHSLSLNQSSFTLQNMFTTQRSLVSKFPELLFEEDTEQCADLCLRLLRHCSSALPNIRSHASASLYMLMRQNYEIGNNFARVKMQVTMSLSSLVGQNRSCNEEFLRKSLKTILVYADADLELKDTTFPDQVRDLVFNLHMILSDTIKMKEFQEDPEMLLDLMYRIAKGYQNSPDLRLTWLQNMSNKHRELRNWAEAAQCLVHAAGLVAEYLNMLEDKSYLPIGCVSLQHISRNVLEESAVSEDVVSPDEEGICTGKFFSEHGLVALLEQASNLFNMAGMYEAVNNLYKVLIPVFENSRDFKKLASIHKQLYDSFCNIVKQEGKRVFGTYFRVGFYGSRFGDLDGQEFIYKEPAITKLPEISSRLESFYMSKFGHTAIEMIKDSNLVEKDKLKPDKAYIQITYVEPHFELYELRDRVTFFEKNYNIKRFVYATPFTLDGKAHGELRDQYKRKTILTTSHAFPYVKTRLQVINREQLILSPIEVAIEDIQKKTKELGIALRQEPPDPKMLQMVLQGCIGTTVNQGPVEMANVFLSPLMDMEIPSKHHNKLRSCFKDFLKKCGDALHRNKSLIGLDQKEYQRELERNYHQIKDQLSPLISSSVHTDTLKSRHKRKPQRLQPGDYDPV